VWVDSERKISNCDNAIAKNKQPSLFANGTAPFRPGDCSQHGGCGSHEDRVRIDSYSKLLCVSGLSMKHFPKGFMRVRIGFAQTKIGPEMSSLLRIGIGLAQAQPVGSLRIGVKEPEVRSLASRNQG
jgi:hypothetical protein